MKQESFSEGDHVWLQRKISANKRSLDFADETYFHSPAIPQRFQLDKMAGQCDVERGMRGLTGVFEGLTLHNKCDVSAYATVDLNVLRRKY